MKLLPHTQDLAEGFRESCPQEKQECPRSRAHAHAKCPVHAQLMWGGAGMMDC